LAEVSSLHSDSAAVVSTSAWPMPTVRCVTCSAASAATPFIPPVVTCTGTLPLETQGTVTVSEVAVAAVTVATRPPMVTVLLAAVVLKLVPVRVAEAPGTMGLGETEVTCGATLSSSPAGVSVETMRRNVKLLTLVGIFRRHCLADETSDEARIPSAPSSPWSTPPMAPPYWKYDWSPAVKVVLPVALLISMLPVPSVTVGS
jgi:hypothetical protein